MAYQHISADEREHHGPRHNDDAHKHGLLVERQLPFIASPVNREREPQRPLTGHNAEPRGWRHGVNKSCPEFSKHSASTHYEMFFDLWFVANLGVYSETHGTTDTEKLWSYLGYLVLLWVTWFLVGMFDVRFVTDSLFERVARTVHLGVMVGFTVVGPRFNPLDQVESAFQGLSLILMVSRLILAVQYGSVAWQIRRYRDGMLQVGAVAGLHLVTGLIYLGISFRFDFKARAEGTGSRVYLAWYVIGILEAAANLGTGLWFRSLSFEGTHLAERMTVLTLIILGEGVVSIAKNIALIVENEAWTGATIGVLTAAIAMVYMFFMIYFDWMNLHHLRRVRQAAWAILHLPFHVSLLIFMDGAANFITFWKILELQQFTKDTFTAALQAMSTDPSAQPTSAYLAGQLNNTVQLIWEKYMPTYALTTVVVNDVLADIAAVPESYWQTDGPVPALDGRIENDTGLLLITVVNSVFVNFKIDPFAELVKGETDIEQLQYDAYGATLARFVFVWQYTYMTAGLVLMLLTLLYVAGRKRDWVPFNIFRIIFFFLLGAGCCLVLLLSNDKASGSAFLLSPWLLPTLCLVFFVVLVITHLPSPRSLFFAPPPRRPSSSRSVVVPARSATPDGEAKGSPGAGQRGAGYSNMMQPEEPLYQMGGGGESYGMSERGGQGVG